VLVLSSVSFIETEVHLHCHAFFIVLLEVGKYQRSVVVLVLYRLLYLHYHYWYDDYDDQLYRIEAEGEWDL